MNDLFFGTQITHNCVSSTVDLSQIQDPCVGVTLISYRRTKPLPQRATSAHNNQTLKNQTLHPFTLVCINQKKP